MARFGVIVGLLKRRLLRAVGFNRPSTCRIIIWMAVTVCEGHSCCSAVLGCCHYALW